ncbi:MAG: bifunctional 3-deoxy-7-phosphoheptulonate synthase/chorismate mutase type II [Rikenellaceae bacterium]
MSKFEIDPILFPELGEMQRPLLISGPCSAETREQVMETAEALAASGIKIFRAGIWKPRTKPGGFEGIGEEGLKWLQEVKAKTGMLVATEVATVEHVELALKYKVDMLWIGARTSANPFSVQQLADALKGADVPVLVKNPVSPDLELWIGALQRIINAGIKRIGAIHRGFSLYETSIYRNHPQWAIPIELHRRYPELPIICDPSHITGDSSLIESVSQQAMDLGFAGLMIESHCTPAEAWSDAKQQVTPQNLAEIMSALTIRDVASTPTEDMSQLRKRIDQADGELIELLARRMGIAQSIGEYKKANGIQILQSDRYEEIIQGRVADAEHLGLSPEFVKEILQTIHEESVNLQIKIYNS